MLREPESTLATRFFNFKVIMWVSRKSHNESSSGKVPIGSTQAMPVPMTDATCFPGPLAEVISMAML